MHRGAIRLDRHRNIHNGTGVEVGHEQVICNVYLRPLLEALEKIGVLILT